METVRFNSLINITIIYKFNIHLNIYTFMEQNIDQLIERIRNRTINLRTELRNAI